jgi:hypothetical protein
MGELLLVGGFVPLEADHIPPGGESHAVIGGALEDEELILSVAKDNTHVVCMTREVPYSLLVKSRWMVAAEWGERKRTISRELADF